MSNITELGERLFDAQRRLGLENPSHHEPGLSAEELETLPPFLSISAPSELHDLFRWRNGASQKDVAMGKLWIRPGFYIISAQESILSNRYCAEQFDDWSRSWYPLLTDGAADRRFYDVNKTIRDRVPILFYEPEEVPVTGQIYDSIELMLRSFLECYERGVYFVGQGGLLSTNFRREVEISRDLNPESDYWRRMDLVKP